MPRVCLPFVIVVFPDHTHLLFLLVFIVLILFSNSGPPGILGSNGMQNTA